MNSPDSKDVKVTEFFEHDHRQMDESFHSYRKLKEENLEAARGHFLRFHEELLTHIEWEEDIVFPVFEEKMGKGLTGTMRREHEQIQEVLESIRQTLEQSEIPEDRMDQKLLKFLEPHNKSEETVVYPAIDRHLSTEEVERIFDRLDH